MAKKYDVIVVGGGPGGLTCAALLAKWGLKPLLLDKNESTGGKAVTVSRNGFTYDLAPKLQCPMRGSAIEQAYVMLGIESELRPIYLEGEREFAMSYRRRGSDKYLTAVNPQQGADATALFDLMGLSAEERERTVSVMTDIAMMSQEAVDALDDLTFAEYMARHKDVPYAVYSYLAMMSNSSLAEPVDLVSASEQVRIMQDIIRGGGGGYYVGGFGRVLDNLAKAIKANGGEIGTRKRVEKIEISDGQVIGVVAGGEEFRAPIVVSDAGIQPTVLKLVGEEHFDKGYVNYIKGLVPGGALPR
jgi:prolycopene isomerase